MNDTKIKVLQVGLSSNKGGIENVVHSWSNLLPSNIQFDFINIENSPIAFQDEFIEKGSKIFNITPRRVNVFKSFSELKEIIKAGNYDYVHQHMMSYAWPEPIIAGASCNKPKLIAHSHTAGSDFLSTKDKLLDYIGRKKLAKVQYFKIACGEVAGLDMFHSNDYTIIHNGVNFEKNCFSDGNRLFIRNQYGIKDSDFLIGHVGRSSKAKNYPYIIKLFKEFKSKNPNSYLMLIGDVENDNDVKRLVVENNLISSVIFTGVLSNLSLYYSAMDVFILPSLYEGVSVSLIEAQLSGLICIVSENISKESDISGNVRYVSLKSLDEGIKEIGRVNKIDRSFSKLKIDSSYDIRNTSKQMFDFYESHLN